MFPLIFMIKVLTLFNTEQGSLRITKLARFDCPSFQDGQVLDIAQAKDELTYVLEELAPAMGANPQVIIGVRGPMVTFQRKEGFRTTSSRNYSIIREQDITEALNNAKPVILPPDTQIVDVWTQSFAVGEREGIRNPRGMSGISLEARVFISYANSGYLTDLKEVLQACNLTEYRLYASAVPIAQQLPSPSEKQKQTMVLDIGEDASSALFYNKGLLVEGKNLSCGYRLMVQNLAEFWADSYENVKNMLDNYECDDDNINDAIEDSVQFMLKHIYKALCQSSIYFMKHQPRQIIVTGSGILDFTAPLTREIFNAAKARACLLEPETDHPDDVAEETTDLRLFTGALCLIYHHLQLEDNAEAVTGQSGDEGLFGKILDKFGLNGFSLF